MPDKRDKCHAHQNMPAVNEKSGADNQQNGQRVLPQADCGKFRTARKIQPHHQHHFQPAHPLLRRPGTQNQPERHHAYQDGDGFDNTAPEFGKSSGMMHDDKNLIRLGGIR